MFRELENVIERTVALEGTEMISSGSLPVHLRGDSAVSPTEHTGLPEEGLDIEEYLDNMRLSLMRQALERTGGHQKKASELLRMSYRALSISRGEARTHTRREGMTGTENSMNDGKRIRPKNLQRLASQPVLSPGSVARAARCRAQWGFRPRGPAGAPSAGCSRKLVRYAG